MMARHGKNVGVALRAACVMWIVSGTHVAAARAGEADERLRLDKLDPDMAVQTPDGKWAWYDVRELEIEGKGWAETEAFFHRLPAKAEGVVRGPVWSLSKCSAGLCVRFVTDGDRIAARWTLTKKSLAMTHMPATGVSGVDLYVKDNGRWRWIGVGRPGTFPTSEAVLAQGIPRGTHEYLLYLPLYNGVAEVSVGVSPGAALAKPVGRPANRSRPICFYGTSIVQGGCASRPGMAHPAILGRRLDRPVINLGFSGNGKMEAEIGVLLAELDVAAYVIDCAPNMTPDLISKRAGPFIIALRKARPKTPIVLVENIAYQGGAFLPAKRKAYLDKNDALRQVYESGLNYQVENLHYVRGERLLGNDGEATVDGTHPTDLGFQRIADGLEPVLRKVLNR